MACQLQILSRSQKFFDEVMKGDAAGIAFEKASPPGR